MNKSSKEMIKEIMENEVFTNLMGCIILLSLILFFVYHIITNPFESNWDPIMSSCVSTYKDYDYCKDLLGVVDDA